MQVKKYCFSFLLFIAISPLSAAIPSTFTYQGSLKQNGSPVNGTYTMEFRLTNQTGSTLYWTSGQKSVDILEGLYRTELAPSGVDWVNAEPYMETRVNGTTLLPREKLNATIFAAVSKDVVDGAITPSKLAPLAVTDSKINDVAANKITGQIVSTQIANGAVTSAKIADGQVTAAKLEPSLALGSVDVASLLKYHGANFFKILQIVQAETVTPFSTFSTSFVNTNLSVQITPTPGMANGSKFLIFVAGTANLGGVPVSGYLTIARNGINLGNSSGLASFSANANIDAISMITYDAPGTSAPINYSVQARNESGQNIAFPTGLMNPPPKAVMIVIEVAQ